MEYKINYNSTESRFESVIDNKVIGFVQFSQTDGSITVIHTDVSAEYEGKGIAGALTKELLEYAKRENLKVIAICSYTKAYIKKHSEYKFLEE